MKILKKNILLTKPDAILFDTDNTLYDYNQSHRIALESVKNKTIEIFSITKDEFYTSFNKARAIVKKRLGNTAASHNRLLYFQVMLESLGVGSQVFHSLDLEQTYWRSFLNSAELFPDVKKVLLLLRQLSIPTAVVTDLTSQIQFRKLVFFDLQDLFNYIVTSEESGFDKPHKASFKLALRKINPKGKNIWMIGDNQETDIRGAKKNINAVTFLKIHSGSGYSNKKFKPDIIFEKYDDFYNLLKTF